MANLPGQKAGSPRKTKRQCFGCWNMRTLVESDGTIATAVARKGGRGMAAKEKALFTVQEFSKCGMIVMSIKQTKWYGQSVSEAETLNKMWGGLTFMECNCVHVSIYQLGESGGTPPPINFWHIRSSDVHSDAFREEQQCCNT